MRDGIKEIWEAVKREPGWAVLVVGAVATLGIAIYDIKTGAEISTLKSAFLASGLIIIAGLYESTRMEM